MSGNPTIMLEKRFSAQHYNPLPIVLSRGQGVWVWDEQGHRYMDMLSAYSALSLGHAHPRLLNVLNEQAAKLTLTSRAFYNNCLPAFLAKLCAFTGLDKAIPMNTGAEAVETAIKAARRWGYLAKKIPENKAEIIVADGNFHGRTTTLVGFSSDPLTYGHFGPFNPGFIKAPFGDAEAFRRSITPHTCAILVEPIQGEAGIIIPPAGWLKALRQMCDENNVLLIVDEVQTGLGRTGKVFAFQHEEIAPDGIVVGKALGGGIMPISAFVSRREVMDLFVPGSHGSTFGGNALAARLGLEVLTMLEEQQLWQRSAALGESLLNHLRRLKSPFIKECRGRGLFIGLEVERRYITGRVLAEHLAQYGLLTKDTHETVLRLSPPLIITPEEIEWACQQLTQAFNDLQHALGK